MSATAALLLSGCASLGLGPDAPDVGVAVPQSPTDQPDGTPDWVEYAPDALPSTTWLADFADPALMAAVDEAVLENPRLLQQRALFDAALDRRRISRADLYPNLNAAFRSNRSRGGSAQFGAGSDFYELGLNASWELDLFGRIGATVDADQAGAEASAADLAALRLSIASQVARTWFDAVEAELLVDLSEREIETNARSLRLTERRFEAGLTGASDVRLARSSLASAEALQQLRIQNRNALVRSLQTLLRNYPDATLALPADLPALPPLGGAGGPDWVLAQRPDIIAEERRIAQAGFNVQAARAALYPRFSLSAGLSDQARSGAPSFGSIEDIFDLSELASSIGTSLTAPIFQGGRIRAQIDVSEAQLRAQAESYVQTALTAFQEVENALDAESLLAAREAALQQALTESRAAEERLQRRYIEGLASILQLLDAQTRRLNAEGQLIGSRSERLANRVRLHTALGGGRFGAILPTPEPASPLPDIALPDIAFSDLPLIGSLSSNPSSSPSSNRETSKGTAP